MDHLLTWRGLQWSSSQRWQSGMKACTPAMRPSITTWPQSKFKWRSRVRANTLVRHSNVIPHSKSGITLVLKRSCQHDTKQNELMSNGGFTVLCVCLCVAALVSMIGISSASAIVLILIVTLWACWWVKCLHRWQVAAQQVMHCRANEGNAASAVRCETNRMCRSLRQLTKTPVSQTGSNVAKADRCLCHRRPGRICSSC